jgi:probable H4MPT-linked C1 transfer pathway protein
MSKQQKILGWDIGGAYLKVALIDSQAVVLDAVQIACPLWTGLHCLEDSAKAAERQLQLSGFENYLHVITMTGELVDLFESRDQGVAAILQSMQKILGDGSEKAVWIFSAPGQLLELSQVQPAHYDAIASANWLATAAVLVSAEINTPTLLVDIGSTTTDIVPLNDGKLSTHAVTDYERLCSGELVYSGVVRTPLMSVADHCYFAGQRVSIMAEHFATTADVYRLTEELSVDASLGATADNQDQSLPSSARRLARMIGRDIDECNLHCWIQLALYFKAQQLITISNAIHHVASGFDRPCNRLVGAGVGRFLVEQIAHSMQIDYCDFSDLPINCHLSDRGVLADYAPAVSVALRLHSQLHHSQ